MKSCVVSSEWLNEHKQESDLIILDASPTQTATGQQSDYQGLSIPNARYFDLKHVFSAQNREFPNTFPSVEQFEIGCRNLGITNSSRIVVYDNLGIYTSPRAYWLFKAMGHSKVAVLDGGLPDWIEKGFETSNQHFLSPTIGDFTSSIDSKRVANIDFIRSNISSKEHHIIDARSEERFLGTIKEPRAGLRSGNIPNSFNIPYQKVLTTGKLKTDAELKEVFDQIGIDDRPLTFSCGSGITACILLLAAHKVLPNDTSIYDGSWTEWATLNPKEGDN